MKKEIININERQINFRTGLINSKIKSANEALEQFKHDYRKILTLDLREIESIAKGNYRDVINDILDRVYPTTPPEYRAKYVSEIRNALNRIEPRLNISTDNGNFNLAIDPNECIEVVKGVYQLKKGADKYIKDFHTDYIETPELIKEYKDLLKAIEVIEKVRKRLETENPLTYDSFYKFLEFDDTAGKIYPITIEFSENPNY